MTSTAPARNAVIQAQGEARLLRHAHIGNEHVLLGLLHDGDEFAARILADHGVTLLSARSQLITITGNGELDATALASVGIDLAEVRRRIEATFGAGVLNGPVRSETLGHLPFTDCAKHTLELSLREARRLKDRSLGAEHILLALTYDVGGLVERMLVADGLELAVLRAAIHRRLAQSA